jgi:hypothetical protein
MQVLAGATLCKVMNDALSKDDKDNGGGNGGKLLEDLSKLQKVRSVSTMTMSDRHEVPGFESLKTTCCEHFGGVRQRNLQRIIDIYLAKPFFMNMSAEIRRDINDSIAIHVLSDPDVPECIKQSNMNFVNGKGKLILFQMCFMPMPEKPDTIQYGFRIAETTFEPARPYVVITHTKSNVFHSKSWCELQYLPAVNTDAHMESIKRSTLSLIADINFTFPYRANFNLPAREPPLRIQEEPRAEPRVEPAIHIQREIID